MNSYRIALIFCRALIINSWWSAGLSGLTRIIAALIVQIGLFGTSALPLPVTFISFMWLSQSFVPLIICAVALTLFAPTLSAAMTGRAMLEGETISSRRGLEADERALASAGAGLMLVIFGLVDALPAIAQMAYQFFTDSLGTGSTRDFMFYQFAISLLRATLRCGVGLWLAFRLGLRRMVQSP